MTFDELQHTWQSQDCGIKMEVDPDTLMRLIRREQRSWSQLILRRDTLEVSAACLLFVLFLYFGVKAALWPLYWAAGTCLFVGGFFVVDRCIQRKHRPLCSQSMTEFIERSIRQINHQIGLLRHVFWWYLLPLGLGLVVFLGHVIYGLMQHNLVWIAPFVIGYGLLVALFFWRVYLLNQRAVRHELIPRKRELEALLQMLASHHPEDAS